MNRTEFCNMLKAYRESKEMSIYRLAQLTSSSAIDITRLEKGQLNFALDSALTYLIKCGCILWLTSSTDQHRISSIEEFVNFMLCVQRKKQKTWYAMNKEIGFTIGTLKRIVNGDRTPSIDKSLAFIDYADYTIQFRDLSSDENELATEKIKEEESETEIPLFIFGHTSMYGGKQRYVTCTDQHLGFIGVVTFYDHMPTRSIGGVIIKHKNLYAKFQLARKFVPEASVKEIKKLMRQCIEEHPVFFQPSQI